MKHKLATVITVTTLLLIVTVSSASAEAPQKIGPGYDVEMSRMIHPRDGIQLEAWLFKPAGLQSKAPTVLRLTQYEIDGITPKPTGDTTWACCADGSDSRTRVLSRPRSRPGRIAERLTVLLSLTDLNNGAFLACR